MPATLPIDARAIGAGGGGVPPVPALLGRARAELIHAGSRLWHLRVRCVLLGHDDTFARAPHRLFLRCAVCGRETSGWSIGRAGSSPSERGTTADARVPRLPLEAPAGSVWAHWRKARGLREGRRLAAAARAAESRALGSAADLPGFPDSPSAGPSAQSDPRGLSAARRRDAGRGDYGRGSDAAAGWSPAKPQVRCVPSQNGLRLDWPQRQSAIGRFSTR